MPVASTFIEIRSQQTNLLSFVTKMSRWMDNISNIDDSWKTGFSVTEQNEKNLGLYRIIKVYVRCALI